MELTDEDREKIAANITDGFTSGVVSGEDYRISWNLSTEKFSDS